MVALWTLGCAHYIFMKNTLLAAIIIITFSASARAQLEERNYFIGTTLGAVSYNTGNFGYDYSTGNFQNQDDKKYVIQMDPAIGIFLSDHLIFGGNLDLSYSHDKGVITNTTGANIYSNHQANATSFTIGPFANCPDSVQWSIGSGIFARP